MKTTIQLNRLIAAWDRARWIGIYLPLWVRVSSRVILPVKWQEYLANTLRTAERFTEVSVNENERRSVKYQEQCRRQQFFFVLVSVHWNSLEKP